MIVKFARVTGPDDVPAAVASFGLGRARSVLVVVGGAAGLDEAVPELGAVFAEVIAPAVRRHEAAAVDGGTDSGVMRLLGQARAAGTHFPLVGVAARGTVRFPGHEPTATDPAELEQNHSHVVLTPGAEWGAEGPYLPLVAAALAAGGPVVTVLINGGEIALDDAVRSIRLGIPVLVLAGTGRTADRIATAAEHARCRADSTAAAGQAPGGGGERNGTAAGHPYCSHDRIATTAAGHRRCGDERIALLAGSELVRVVPVHDRTALAGRLDESLTR